MVRGDNRLGVDPPILGTTHEKTLKYIKKFDPDYKAIKRKAMIPTQSKSGWTRKYNATKLDLCTYLDRPKIPIFRLEHDVEENDLESFAEYVRDQCKTAKVDLFFCKTSLDEMYTQLKLYRPATVPLMVIIAIGNDHNLKHKLGTIKEFDGEFVEAVTRVLAKKGMLVIIGPVLFLNDDGGSIFEKLADKLGENRRLIVTDEVVYTLRADSLDIGEYDFERPIQLIPNIGYVNCTKGTNLGIEVEPSTSIEDVVGDLQMCPLT